MSVILAAGKMLVKVAGPMLVEAGAKAVIDTVTDKVNEFRGKTVEVDGETYTEMNMIKVTVRDPVDDEVTVEIFTVPAHYDTKMTTELVGKWAADYVGYPVEDFYWAYEAFSPESLTENVAKKYRISKD